MVTRLTHWLHRIRWFNATSIPSSLDSAHPTFRCTDRPEHPRPAAEHLQISAGGFAFAAIGDQQYGPAGETKWPALAQSINEAASGLKFVVHTGDIKSGSSLCTDELFTDRLAKFNAV